jgi:hypothetical protein
MQAGFIFGKQIAVSFIFPDLVKNKLIKKSPPKTDGDFFDMNVEK